LGNIPSSIFNEDPSKELVTAIDGYEFNIHEKTYFLDLQISLNSRDSKLYNLNVKDRTNYYKSLQIEQTKKNLLSIKNNDLKVKLEGFTRLNESLRSHVYHLNHDLKHPLDIIKGYMSIINDEEVDEYLQEMLNEINSQVDLMGNMINSSLMLQKIGSNEKKYKDFLNLEQILDQLEKNLSNKKPLVLSREFNEVPKIKANNTLFYKLFYNLLSNSIKYNDNSKVIIEISIVDHGDKLEFIYRDNGRGIAQDQIDLIFEIFYSTDSTESSSFGVGLATVKRIIELYNGSIQVNSELGVGTEFIIQVPVVA
jgi:signal transduction histidine kinase